MAKTKTSSQSTTFLSVGDDFIEIRFSPENKRIFEKNIEAIEAISAVRTYDIPVDFFGRFDGKTQKALHILVNEVFQNAKKYDLNLQYTDPAVHFYTISSWEEKHGRLSKKSINLPASKISWENGTPVVQLVIPEMISSGEEVIKTIRLLVSKLFGKLFFDEHIPHKTVYRLLPDEKEALKFDLEEKIHFCHFFAEFPKSALQEFNKIGRQMGIKGPKVGDFGMKEFFNNLLKEGIDPEQAHINLLESVFQQHVEFVKNDSSEFFTAITDKIFAVIPQSTLLLPYDQKNFNILKKEQQWIIFHALDERLQLVVNGIKELQECRDFLIAKENEQPIDIEISQLWQKSLHERINLLKKKGLVKIFLIEGAKLTAKQKRESTEFPLWIWRNGLFKNFPKAMKPERMLLKITEQYKNSVYQKLLETSFRLSLCIKAMQADDQLVFSACTDYKRLKTLFAWFEIREKVLVDLLYSCRVSSQLTCVANKKKIGKQEILRNFEQGWSYFISFALVHQYYLSLEQKKSHTDKRSERFYEVIDKFVQNRIENQPSFQISSLLLNLYKKENFDLKQIAKLIKQDIQVFDFFIFYQPDLFRNPSQSPSGIIEHYSEAIQQWEIERDRNKIKKEELKELTP